MLAVCGHLHTLSRIHKALWDADMWRTWEDETLARSSYAGGETASARNFASKMCFQRLYVEDLGGQKQHDCQLMWAAKVREQKTQPKLTMLAVGVRETKAVDSIESCGRWGESEKKTSKDSVMLSVGVERPKPSITLSHVVVRGGTPKIDDNNDHVGSESVRTKRCLNQRMSAVGVGLQNDDIFCTCVCRKCGDESPTRS